MRKWLAGMLAFLLTLAPCGCGAEPSREAEAGTSCPAPQTAQQPASSSAAQTMEAVNIKDAGAPLTETEILGAYARAVEAYGWFDLDTLPCGGPGVERDGRLYYRVNEKGFETLESLRIYLRGLFSPALVACLTPEEGEQYRDIDGALYVSPTERGADPRKGAVTASVAEGENGGYLVNVTVETLDEDLQTVSGLEYWSFPYEKVGERWVFTEFGLVA